MVAEREANLKKIEHCTLENNGFDFVIISSHSVQLAEYWSARLKETSEQLLGSRTRILSIVEDWPGGAGNGLGTLYALKKAEELALKNHQVHLLEQIQNGASIAIYHTAGKGTRSAPLSLAECNNKSAIKLPGHIQIGREFKTITLLEAVLKQTSIYASSRKGRLSVFWGDQIFVPSASTNYQPRTHIDILAKKLCFPSADEWKEKGYNQYGVITIGNDGECEQIEKVSFEQLTALLESERIAPAVEIGLSFGSFSISHVLLEILLDTFKEELNSRSGSLDSDPHFWMPLTLEWGVYAEIMTSKGSDLAELEKLYQRMQDVKAQITQLGSSLGLLGIVDVGEDAYWWDFGSTSNYYHNCMKLTGNDEEGSALRRFFHVKLEDLQDKKNPHLKIDDSSIVLNSEIVSGVVKNSIVIDSSCKQVQLTNSLVMDSCLQSIQSNKSVIYHTLANRDLVLTEYTLRADVMTPNEKQALPLWSSLSANKRSDWSTVLPNNTLSFEDCYKLNSKSCPLNMGEKFSELWEDLVDSVD
ncbi:MAG: hypothetical protein CMO81_01730 [Waddliaceae bacterium]|nr:hypothetical protein [Waddliaceae bacterium]